ncbi:MAG: hypothetical protein CL950_10250 [Erythrobacter sp.]|nr:hypothetical protein [Erythrobacter sp.]
MCRLRVDARSMTGSDDSLGLREQLADQVSMLRFAPYKIQEGNDLKVLETFNALTHRTHKFIYQRLIRGDFPHRYQYVQNFHWYRRKLIVLRSGYH